MPSGALALSTTSRSYLLCPAGSAAPVRELHHRRRGGPGRDGTRRRPRWIESGARGRRRCRRRRRTRQPRERRDARLRRRWPWRAKPARRPVGRSDPPRKRPRRPRRPPTPPLRVRRPGRSRDDPLQPGRVRKRVGNQNRVGGVATRAATVAVKRLHRPLRRLPRGHLQRPRLVVVRLLLLLLLRSVAPSHSATVPSSSSPTAPTTPVLPSFGSSTAAVSIPAIVPSRIRTTCTRQCPSAAAATTSTAIPAAPASSARSEESAPSAAAPGAAADRSEAAAANRPAVRAPSAGFLRGVAPVQRRRRHPRRLAQPYRRLGVAVSGAEREGPEPQRAFEVPEGAPGVRLGGPEPGANGARR